MNKQSNRRCTDCPIPVALRAAAVIVLWAGLVFSPVTAFAQENLKPGDKIKVRFLNQCSGTTPK